MRLLIVGDSSAAGVGVDTQGTALAGRLVDILARRADVDWKLVARSGATSGDIMRRVAAMSPRPVDIVVAAFGVNDVKNGVPARRWVQNVTEFVRLTQTRFGTPRVYLSGLPPLGAFPLLPQPLRAVLGGRSIRFDHLLDRIAASHDRVRHVPLDLSLDVSAMAPDGFHPGPTIYAAWAQLLTEAILADRDADTARAAPVQARP